MSSRPGPRPSPDHFRHRPTDAGYRSAVRSRRRRLYRQPPAAPSCARSLRRAATARWPRGASRPPRRQTSVSSAPHSAAGRLRKSAMVVVATSVGPEGRARTIAASRLRSPMAMPKPVPKTSARRHAGAVSHNDALPPVRVAESPVAAALISGRTSAPLRIPTGFFSVLFGR